MVYSIEDDVMRIPLYIEVDDEDDSYCGANCPFLRYAGCVMFQSTLDKIGSKSKRDIFCTIDYLKME